MGRRGGWGKLTVEDSLSFDAVVLHRKGVFRSLPGTQYTYEWSRSGSGADRNIGYTVVELPGVAMGLRLNYEVSDRGSTTKHQMQYVVEVTSTRCRFGGRRFWLRCPLVRNGVPCKRRVLQLYLPPGGRVFGCRKCHGLTYRICQEHDRRIDTFVQNPYLMKIALDSGDLKMSLLAAKACAYLLKRLNRSRPVARRRRRCGPATQAPNRGEHL